MTHKEQLLKGTKIALAANRYTHGEYEDVKTFRDCESGIDGFIGDAGDHLAVGFAGSNENRDWRTNFLYWKRMIPYNNTKTRIRVHRGYLTGYMRLRDEILKEVKASKQKKVLVAGYSMGGGLAPICAVDVQYNTKKKVYCVTGGAPRVYNRAGMKSYNRRVPGTTRVIYGNDLVPRVPPFLFGFRHIGGEMLHFGPKWRWWKFWAIKDHVRINELVKEIEIYCQS